MKGTSDSQSIGKSRFLFCQVYQGHSCGCSSFHLCPNGWFVGQCLHGTMVLFDSIHGQSASIIHFFSVPKEQQSQELEIVRCGLGGTKAYLLSPGNLGDGFSSTRVSAGTRLSVGIPDRSILETTIRCVVSIHSRFMKYSGLHKSCHMICTY